MENYKNESNSEETSPGRLKVYDSWADLPIERWGNDDDLDGVLIYHTGTRNKVADVLLSRYYPEGEAEVLTTQECRIVGVLYPASIIGLYH